MANVIRRAEGGILTFFCAGCQCSHGVNSGWTFNGDFERPTFTPSILVRGYKMSAHGEAMIARGERHPEGGRYPGENTVCHSFVTDGKIQFLDDCTHALAGKTVALEGDD